MLRRLAIAFVAFGLTFTWVADARSAGWKRAFAENGVVVDTRAGAGGNMPEFRGGVTVAATVWEVLAVIDDLDAVCEWTKRCVQNKELRRDSFTKRVFYNRTGAPWPFSDRDAVMLGEVSGLHAGTDIRLRFNAIKTPLKPPVDGVVRMPTMSGLYRITRIDDRRTRVVMQIRAHPGGWVPDWAAKWVSKRIPIDTLSGLRKQLPKTRKRYAAFVAKWTPKPAAAPPPLQTSQTPNAPKTRAE